jgi:hypothetical protein
MDISLYGHLTFDRIFEDFKEYNSIGSIGNVWNFLLKINPKLKVNIQPTAIGEALVLVNKNKTERTSVGQLNIKTKKPIIVDSKWNHIMYINELPDLSFIYDIKKGIISADLCKGKPIENKTVLQHIDYLFISDEDVFMNIKELGKLIKGWVIMHHKGGSECTNGNKTIETKVSTIENVNVLGVGDMFAASFMNEYLNSGSKKLKDIVVNSHKEVTNHLESMVNEKS